jgi:hypothetical protein
VTGWLHACRLIEKRRRGRGSPVSHTFESGRRCRLKLSPAHRQRPPLPLSRSSFSLGAISSLDCAPLVQAVSGAEGSAAFVRRGLDRSQNGSPVSVTGWRPVFHVL